MTIQEMRERKIELGYSNKMLSELSDVPEATIQKIFSGSTTAPRKSTLDKLASVLGRKKGPSSDSISASGSDSASSGISNSGNGSYISNDPDRPVSKVMETQAVYGNIALTPSKKDGEYTLNDYLALPDEQRVELIDGVFYDMAAPTSVHQIIGGYIHKILMDHVLNKKGPCIPLISPVDVQLDEDDRTVVQPDVLIVCDRQKFKNGRIFGAPDFIVEVLSPSTHKKDMYLKLFKYMNAGVREYWLIDPVSRDVIVYDLERQSKPVTYSFDDQVPVLIWGGECKVDFSAIYNFISFLYE